MTAVTRDSVTRDMDKEAERQRQQRQRMRSIAIAVSLALLVALLYAATLVRLGGNAMNRPM